MSKDNRKLARRHLIYYLNVVDSVNGQLIGHLVDLTHVGMMLICEKEQEIGKEVHFNILFPGVMEGIQSLAVVGKSVWCHKDVNPNYYVAGYQFSQVSRDTFSTIQDLIEAIGFHN